MRNAWLLALLAVGCAGEVVTGPQGADETAAAAGALVVGADAEVSGTGGGLNLREGPSTGHAVLLVMAEGARLHVDGGVQNAFYPVTYEGQAGWAYGGYLRTVGEPGGAGGEPPTTLQAAVDALVAELGARSPGTEVAIAVKDLTTGEYAQVGDAVPHVSASSAKAVWVAAALDGAGLAAVTPYAEPIFRSSDNYASGAVIDLIGASAVNDFYWRAGMNASALTQWSYGRARVATNSPRALGSDNYLTAGDAVTFLAALDQGTLLGASETDWLKYWMTLSPRSGYGGWLGTDLPAAARAGMMHKAGWLPPGCCGDDAYYNTLNDMGVIEAPNGHRLALAIFARRGADYWNKQARFVSHAACVLYRVAAADPALNCN